MNTAITYSLDQINHAAKWAILQLGKSRLLALHGEMGAGKTTLTQEILKQLGSEDMVQSPTYSLVNVYELGDGQRIYHMDWYRVKDEEEAFEAGIEEMLQSGCLCIVEWPNRIPGLLHEPVVHLQITGTDSGSRELKILQGLP